MSTENIITPCDFCLLRANGDCKYDPKDCQHFWCNLPDAGCGFNSSKKEGCYGFDQCPNVTQFYAEKKGKQNTLRLLTPKNEDG